MPTASELSDLYWYSFFHSGGDTRPFKRNRHFVQWDERPYRGNEERERVLGRECAVEARIYCPTCDTYLCLAHHYLIHLVEEEVTA
jgi:hypothetical protein